MQLEEKVKIIAENVSDLTTFEVKLLRRTYATFNSRKVAHEEANEMLSDEYYNQVQLTEQKIELDLLTELLEKYFYSKGFKQSLLKAEELLQMIVNDRNNVNDLLQEKKDTTRNMAILVSQLKKGANHGR